MAENFSQRPAAVAAADGVVLKAAPAATAAWRQSEANLLLHNLQPVHAEYLWSQTAPAPSRINSTSFCNNTKKHPAALSNGMGSRTSTPCQSKGGLARGSSAVTASCGARLVEAGLPPMTLWGDDIVAGAAVARSASQAIPASAGLQHSQHASASIVSRSFAPATLADFQAGIDISPRDSAQKFTLGNNLALAGGFCRDLRTPLEDLRASGISSNASHSGSSNPSNGLRTNGRFQPPAFREILHRHYEASANTAGSRRRQSFSASPRTFNAALAGQVQASPRSSVLF